MPVWLQIAGTWGGILTVIALAIVLLKQIIAFVGFLTAVIKFALVAAFIGLFIIIALLVYRTWSERKKEQEL